MPSKSKMKCYFQCATDGHIHRFPKSSYQHEERFNLWKEVLDPATQNRGNKYISDNIRLCNRHFKECYQLHSHQLTRNAVPTLNLQHASQSQLQQQIILETLPAVTASQIEKSYSEEPQERSLPSTSCVLAKTCSIKEPTRAKCKKEIVSLKQRLLKCMNKCKTQAQRIRVAVKLSKTKAILEAVEKLPEPIKIFTNLQLKHQKKPKGRKYSLKEKILSLTIFKQGPKVYRLLQKLFVLPSKRTLQQLLSGFVLKPGLNKHIIDSLKQAVNKLPAEKRLCSLLFDEVSLSPGVNYSKLLKEIVGFEDTGEFKTNKLADHALVLMVKSLKGKFKQPICFTFCQSATKKEALKQIITETIKAVNSTGLQVVCTVCDQSGSNMSAIKQLLLETQREHERRGEVYSSTGFEIDGRKIFPIFDPPHLLKGIRNNLLVKNLRYIDNGVVKVAKWDHIMLFAAKDTGEDEVRLISKLTEAHINKEKIPKMKVKYAAQVFSERLSAAIRFCTKHGLLPKECMDTADLLLKIDQLFDTFNGHSYTGQPKKYRSCLKHGSAHWKFWEDILPVLRSMGFETKKKNGSIVYEKVPSITNMIHNITTYKEMWQYLAKFKVTSLLTRNINQDPLENFFCKIRSNGLRNVNPTCDQFVSAYKTLLVNNMASPHSINANCEQDSSSLLQNMENFVTTGTKNTCDTNNLTNHNIEIDCLLGALETGTIHGSETNNIQDASKSYVAGYVIKKARAKFFKNCSSCIQCLLTNDHREDTYIYERDYTKKSLHYPSNEFLILMKDLFHLISRCLQESPELRLLPERIRTFAEIYCNFDFITCNKHACSLKQYVVHLTFNVIVYSWCFGVNKILKGRLHDFDPKDNVKQQAFNYRKKHMKYKT